MGSRTSDKSGPKRRSGTTVADGSAQRPFMRGIMVHSLMSRGMAFSEAFRVASAVRERVRGRSSVTREELREIVGEVADPKALRELRPEGLARTPVLVTGQGRGAPFSKGFLSQSLLAAAIEPNDAFDVARQIEDQLGRSGTREIHRHEIRRLAYEALHNRLGPRAAERYLVWRKHQEPERPVILLLGGSSGAGKTSLAQEVAHRLGIARVLSTDSIRQVMRLMLSPELAPAIHASSYDAHLSLGDALESEEPVLEGFRTQAATVSVGVRAMMDRAIAENSNLILDGVSIVPGMIDPASYADRAEVIFLLVATLDSESFANRFSSRGESATERPPHRYLENLPAIEKIQDHLLELAETHDVPIVDNDSFDRSVISIIRHVTETLRKKDKLDVADLF